jgi:hypothetical protein
MLKQVRFVVTLLICVLVPMIADGLWNAGYIADLAQTVANRAPRGVVEPIREGCSEERQLAMMLAVYPLEDFRNICIANCKTWIARDDGICYAEDEPKR